MEFHSKNWWFSEYFKQMYVEKISREFSDYPAISERSKPDMARCTILTHDCSRRKNSKK